MNDDDGYSEEDEEDEDEEEDMDASMLIADVVRNSVRARTMLRRALQRVRTGITDVRTISLPQLNMFIHDCLIPRLNEVLLQIDSRVNEVYLIEKNGPNDLEKLRTMDERMKEKRRYNATHMGPMQTIEYKFSDIAVSLMYALKGLRLLMQVGALFVAQKVFVETYVRAVHVDNEDPPRMTRMLVMFMSIDATLQLLTLLVLVLLSYAYKAGNNTYVIDDDFIMSFLVEYFVCTAVTAVLGVLFARIMRRKQYFNYAGQGIVVSRAYRDSMIVLCVITFAVPFFLIM